MDSESPLYIIARVHLSPSTAFSPRQPTTNSNSSEPSKVSSNKLCETHEKKQPGQCQTDGPPPASPATRRGPKHTQPIQRHSAFQAYPAGQSRQRFRRSLFQTSLRRCSVSELTRARANHSWAVATGTGAYPAAAASCARHRLGIGAGLLTMSAEPLNANRAQSTQINSSGGSDFNCYCYYYYCCCFCFFSVIFIFHR